MTAAAGAVVPALTDGALSDLLRGAHTIAIVGASPNPARPSFEVMAFLQARGIRCHPVNPAAAGGEILGETVVSDLAEVPAPVDVVNVFRNSSVAGAAVDVAIVERQRLSLRAVWLQLGVRDDAAMARAAATGLIAVQNRCIAIEYGRLLGRRSV